MSSQVVQTNELSIQVTGDSESFTFKIPNPKSTVNKDTVVAALGDILKTKIFASNLSSDTTEFTTILGSQLVNYTEIGTVKKIVKQETIWKD